MSAAGRLGDIASGHGCFPPTPIIAGSSDTSINGLPAARKGDAVLLHACPCPYMPHGIHGRSISAGSPTVFINGKPAARIGDAINCGGSVAAGSPNVYIGSKSYRSPVHECVKNAVVNNEPFLSITPLVDALPTTWYLNNYTYQATTAAKAVETSPAESSEEGGFGLMDGIHAALDAGGLAPGVGIIPDALNTLIYAIEGDKVNAAISAAAMIPVVGQSATAAKYAAKAAEATTGVVKAISKSEKAVEVAKDVGKIEKEAVEHLPAKVAEVSPSSVDWSISGPDGLSVMDPRDYEVGKKMYDSLVDKGLKPDRALQIAQELLESGVSEPTVVRLVEGDELFKLVPKNSGLPGEHSPYFMSKGMLDELPENADEIGSLLGLPQVPDSFDLYKIAAKKEVDVYQSQIAPFSVNGGEFLRDGGGVQTLVTDRSAFNEPVLQGK